MRRRERVGWFHSVPKPLCNTDGCDVQQTPENKEEQDKYCGDYGPNRGGYRFTGRHNTRGSPEQDLLRISEMSTTWQNRCSVKSSSVPSGANFHHPELQTELTCEISAGKRSSGFVLNHSRLWHHVAAG